MGLESDSLNPYFYYMEKKEDNPIMAGKITYRIGLEGDTSKLQASLQQALQSLNKISTLSTGGALTQDMREAAKAAQQLNIYLQSATTSTGKIDLSKFSASLKAGGVELKDYANKLQAIGPAGEKAFLEVASAISKAELPIRRTSKLLDGLWTTMKNTVRWQLTSSTLHGFMGALNTAFGYSKDLNRSLNSIQIVTNKATEDMGKFAENANKAAKALSTTTTEYTDASLIYYQQGLSDQEVEGRTNTTIKLANVARESAQQASEQMTAIWNNFYDGSKSLEYYADVMTALGASTASSTQEISAGLQKFAAIADSVGLSYEYAAAALATVTATTRESADVVGTAYRTLFARIQGLLQDEEQDDGTNLNKYSKALAAVGINIKDTSGELKGMNQILDEMGAKWDNLSKAQQLALAQTVAGVRQYTQLIALMDNWDFFQENLVTAMGSEGSLEQQAQTYAKSWEAARDRVKAASEDVYDSIINPQAFIEVDNALTPILTGIAKLIDGMGGLKGILTTTGYIMTTLYSEQIAQSLRDMAYNVSVLSGKELDRQRELKKTIALLAEQVALDSAASDIHTINDTQMRNTQVGLQIQLNEKQKELSSIQLEQLQNQINLNESLGQQAVIYDNIANSAKESADLIGRDLLLSNKTVYELGEDAANQLWDSLYTNFSEFANNKSLISLNNIINLDEDINLDSLLSGFKELNSYKGSIDQLVKQFQGLKSNIELSSPEIQKLINEFNQLTGKEMSISSIDDAVHQLNEELKLSDNAAKELVDVLVNQLHTPASILQDFANKAQEAGNNTIAANLATQAYIQSTHELSAAISGATNNLSGISELIVATSQGLMRLSTGIQAIKNIGSIWSNEDLSLGEKFIQSLSAISMLIPSLVAVHTLYKKVLDQTGQSSIKAALAESLRAASTGAAGAAAGAATPPTAALAVAVNALLAPLMLIVTIAGLILAVVIPIISALIETEDEARESIQQATEAYEEQKRELESLNNELQTTKDRIEELNNQDTLTIVEQEELEKLKQQEASLERQVALQEKLAAEARKTQQEKIEDKFLKSTGSLSQGYVGSIQSDMYRLNTGDVILGQLSMLNSQLMYEQNEDTKAALNKQLKIWQDFYDRYNEFQPDPDLWLEVQIAGLDETASNYQDMVNQLSATRDNWIKEEEFLRAQWISENSEQIQQAEQDYNSYVANILAGLDYEEEKLVEFQKRISDIRHNIYTEGEYEQNFLQPILDNQSVKQISSPLYNTLLNGDSIDAQGLISESIKNELLIAGISVDEFLNWLNDKVDSTKDKIVKKFGEAFDFESLTKEDWDVLMTVNLDNFDSVEELKEFLDNYENNTISVDINGLDSLRELLELLNDSQQALEKALNSYKSQGYLTMDQVQDLIEADESYAQYVTKIGDAYVLTNQSLQDFLDLEEKERQALDATIKSIKEKNSVNADYVQNYSNMWESLLEKTKDANVLDKYNFSDENDLKLFQERTEQLKENAQAYQEGSISAEEYFRTIGNRLSGINTGFQELNKEIDDNIEKTDLYEATLVAATGQIADGLIDLNKQFKTGTITMDQYYRGTIEATKSLITAQSKLNGNIIKVDGVWQLKDGIDQSTLSAEEYTRAIQDINDLNTWEKQVSQANDLIGIVDTLVDHYDYLVQYADSFGSIDFTIDNNFDTTAAEFQDLCSDISNNLITLEQANNESYKRILQGVLDQGITLTNGLNTSATELMNSMQNNAQLTGAVVDSMMHESSNTITSVSQAAGLVLEKLGNLISNFDYNLDFTPYVKSWGKLQIQDWIEGKASLPFELPTLGLKISGSGGASVQDFAGALSEAANFLSSKGTGTGQGGIYDYGIESPKYDPSGVLDPDRISTDNIRDKNSGSKKGSEKKKEELKDLKDIEDRYHEINRQIKRQNDLLDDIDNAVDRAYGGSKLKGFSSQLSALQRQQENYLSKLAEAENYLDQDLSRLQSLFDNVQLDANGEILNYSALLEQTVNEHNAFIEQYNAFLEAYSAMTQAEQEANQAAYNAWVARKEMMEQTFQARQDALKQYESTLDTIQEMRDAIEDNLRAQADAKLSQVEYKLEIVLDVKEMKDALREFDKQVNEIFGDALTHGLSVANLDRDQAQAEADMYPEYKRQYDELVDLYNTGDQYMDKERIIEDIQDLQGKVLGSAEAIVEWVNSIEDLIPDAIDAARERYNLFTDQLEHNTTVLDTVKELYILQGTTYKTMEGFNRLQKVSQERLESQLAQSQLQRAWYDEARVRFEEAQARLDSLNGDESDLRYDTYKKERDALLAEMNEAEESYLSLAKDAMETAQAMYEEQLEKAVYDFGQIVSNGVGLDLLQDKYNHYIETNGRYLDKVNEAYQTTAWFNKLQQDIDKATNSATRDRLKALQEEINIRRENNKLSQYDLDILNAKYEVLQAQMALEDAQNAKNQLQLVRDSQGNWNYQYTADQDQVANAQQELLDKENEWYSIAKQQVTDVTGEIIATWQECQDKIREIYSNMTLTDEERADRAAEIYSYYTDKIKYLEEEKQIAISDMTEAGNANLFAAAVIMGDELTDLTGMTSDDIQAIVEQGGDDVIGLLTKDNETIKNIIASNTNLIDLFDNVYAKDLNNMTITSDKFESALQKTLDRAQTDYEQFRDKVIDVADKTGTSLDKLDEKTNEVAYSTDRLRDSGLEASQALWNMIDVTINATQGYLNMAQSIWSTVEALRALAAAQASFVESQANSGDFDGSGYDGGGRGSGSSGNTGGGNGLSNKPIDEQLGIAYAIWNGTAGWGNGAERKKNIENKFGAGAYETYQSLVNDYDIRNKAATGAWTNDIGVYSYDELRRKYGISAYASGGYTGDFSDAKLAFLHEKELVLNQDDTKNILTTVGIARDIFSSIEKAIDGNGIAAMALMAERLGMSAIPSTRDSIEQTIHIDEVSFPNITSADGLEEAFRALPDRAKQWSRIKKD